MVVQRKFGKFLLMNKLKYWFNRLRIKFLKMEFLPLEELTLMRLMSDDKFVASDSLESIMELEKIEEYYIPSGQNSCGLNIECLNAGMYFVRILNDRHMVIASKAFPKVN